MDTEKKEGITADQPELRWCIDLDWYRQNNRSFVSLAQSYLCPKCAKELSEGRKGITESVLLSTIKDCCSRLPGFISGDSPILESILCIFLANGNQTLATEELGTQLSEWRGSDTYRTSPEMLTSLLKSDCYYGLREVRDQAT